MLILQPAKIYNHSIFGSIIFVSENFFCQLYTYTIKMTNKQHLCQKHNDYIHLLVVDMTAPKINMINKLRRPMKYYIED